MTQALPAIEGLPLERLVTFLPSPTHPLHGRRIAPLPVPDNIICFCRRSATDLNHPQRGRALHHRFVLIFALVSDVTVCVDDQAIRLHAGEGLLVFPFQFHDYVRPERKELDWLFVTFELIDAGALLPLRFRPFGLTPVIRQLATDLVTGYLTPGGADLTTLLLMLLLIRACQAEPTGRRRRVPAGELGFIPQVNQLALGKGRPVSVGDIARGLGISVSHLRARFRASCGVSLGRHLRRLQLEKACGLMRLSRNRVSEVGELCGFNSIHSFSRAFHAAYGVSPLAYRQGKPAVAARKR